MYFDEFKHQLPDIDESETAEWLESLDQVVARRGREPGPVPDVQAAQAGAPAPRRAAAAHPDPLHQHDQPGAGAVLPGRRGARAADPPADPLERGGDGPPGEHELPRDRRPPRHVRLGGDASTRSASTTSSGARTTAAGDQIFYQGHAAPGIYARAFLEGRLTEDQLDHFRREVVPGQGLSSYPHPRLMPDFWEFPTVSMGIGPISAIYQARFNRYLQNRGLKDTSGSRVWAFLGDGEMDEPESIAGLSLAAREGLDNLTFVVNCNLQRLDGPVRGNGKIIQELEGLFRGAGWNVIKVIWGREWDDLLARDVDGVLVEQMNETLDGEFQKFSVAGGAYIREHFFGPDPRLRRLVEHLTDDDLAKLRRGGHDYRKVFAAYKAATEYVGAPTVDPRPHDQGLDARTGGRGAQHHPPGQEAVRDRAADLPRPARAADPGLGAQGRAVLPPGPRFGGGPLPARAPGRARRVAPEADRPGEAVPARSRRRSTPSSPPGARPRSARRWSSPGSCATSSATRSSGRGSCRSSPTRRARSGSTRCSRRSASTPRSASATSRSTRTSS